MKIAAIDLGSNSLHMLIAEANRSGGFQILASEKDMVRLGSGTLSRGRLPAAAMRRALEVLRDYRRLVDALRVDRIKAVATSAVREAGNGEDFIERIGRETGIYPKAISGEQEARLIYLAALHSVHLEGRRALVIDIGGGSVEIALGNGREVVHAASEKIGVLRMAERFVRDDPISARDARRLERHLEEVIEPHRKAILAAGFDHAVATSGTVLALGALAREIEGGRPSEILHHVTVKTATLRMLRKRLAAGGLRERLRMRGMDPKRADIIVPGAIILDTILSRLGVKELILSEWALREGILLNYISRHPRTLARAEAYPDVRRRSVMELAERCLYDEPHARQVSSLALSLFDGTRRIHGLGEAERDLLEHASILHDIGHHVSHMGHSRHSYYLIKNGGLRGFHPQEIDVIAGVARHHRRGAPHRRQPASAALPRAARRTVMVLAGILRIADALDRSHRQIVKGIRIACRDGLLRLGCGADRDIELELWGARRRQRLLEKALGLRIRIAASSRPGPAATAAPRRAPARSL